MIDQVFEAGFQVLQEIRDTQKENLDAAAKMIADCFINGHTFFVTGSGHSHTVAEEFYARAGGLAFVKPILTSELTLVEHATKSTYLERLPGYAEILTEIYHVSPEDVVLVASNSGRNAYPIEMAMDSKKRGAKVIAITNCKHSRATTSRHPSGKHLMDLADIVIDNCGVPGDCILQIKDLDTALCPTSSMANAFIVQAISVQCARYIQDAGLIPPVFDSSNSQSDTRRNDEYFKKYTRQY